MDSSSKRGRVNSLGGWLLRRSPPAFGQIATWFLLAMAVLLACLPVQIASGVPAGNTVSWISWLPREFLSSPATLVAVRTLLFVSAVLWACGRFLPWVCWTTVAGFALMWSLRVENAAHVAHTFNLANMLLLLHALWYQFYWREIRDARRQHRFWSTPLYPNWAQMSCVFYIGWFHTLAGLAKLTASGPDWGNGLSLQLWVYLFGWPGSPFGQLVLSHRGLAAVLQTASLVIETGAIVCVVSRTLRWIVGVALLSFYLGVLVTFVNFGFHFNAILVAWFLLPFDRWVERIRGADRSPGAEQR